MPENLRALIVILAISIIIFRFGKRGACMYSIAENDYNRRRNLWFGVTLAAFLSHNFWLFLLAAGVLIYYGSKLEQNKMALYFFLFFAVPMIVEMVSFFGVFNIFEIHYIRLLSFTILLPALAGLKKDATPEFKFGYHLQDKILLLYLILFFLLNFFDGVKEDTATNIFRYHVFYAFIDVYLPYFVASRTLNTLQDFRDVLMSYVMACMVLAVVAVQECGRHWLLYASLQTALGVPWDYGKYLSRGAFLRALGTPGQAIALGYVMAVAVGLFLYFRKTVGATSVWRFGFLTLVAGLIAAMSRGPWIGALAMIVVFIMTGPQATPNIIKLCFLALVMISILSITPAWNSVVDYLPFVGSVDSENVTFREQLLDESVDIILENPFFGSRKHELEQFRTGEGIIDIVNTYLNIGLASGLIGLGLFISFFGSIIFEVYSGMRRLPNKNDELYTLGSTLFAVLIGILLIIFTVSSVTVIPYIYWSLAGVALAYTRLVRETIIQKS